MTRALTQAQLIRRSAIVTYLIEGVKTADEVRKYLARVWIIYVMVDTVQRDLRVMERDGIVVCRGRLKVGYQWELRRAV